MHPRLSAALLAAVATFSISASGSVNPNVEISFVISPTSFDARNYSSANQIVLFRNAGQDLVVARTIPSGVDVLYTFTRQALEGVEVEVVGARGSVTLTNSGVIPLSEIFAAGIDRIWVERVDGVARVWLEDGGVFEVYAPDATMLPDAVVDAGNQSLVDYGSLAAASSSSSSSTSHVPGVLPSDRPEDYGPPVLEDEPLPSF
jgi:hypothetical protein